jgi:hypothetical protein
MEQYVGLDVSQKETAICVIDSEGKRMWQGTCRSTSDAIAEVVRTKAPLAAKVAMETGPLAVWHWHALKTLGVPIVQSQATPAGRGARAVGFHEDGALQSDPWAAKDVRGGAGAREVGEMRIALWRSGRREESARRLAGCAVLDGSTTQAGLVKKQESRVIRASRHLFRGLKSALLKYAREPARQRLPMSPVSCYSCVPSFVTQVTFPVTEICDLLL